MKTRAVKPLEQAKTAPPATDQPYMAVEGADGQQEWVLVATDEGDGVTDADMDFDKGKQWAAKQSKANA